MHRVHLFISGRVQGVFFRDSTRQEANKLGVNGWVRNLPDGRVEAVLEGERKPVDELVAWCQHGPPSAAVEDVELQLEDDAEGLQGFEVRSTPQP